MTDFYHAIAQNVLFKNIAETDVKMLMQKINYQQLQFKKDEMIVAAGEICNFLLLIVQGNVRGEMVDFTGKVLKIEDIPFGKPLAIAFLFGQNNKFPVNVMANATTTIVRIWKDELLKILQLNEILLSNYLNLISNKAQFLSEKIKFLSFSTIKEKFTQFLLQSQKDPASPIELKQTQQQLADLFGVTRPSLARAITDMQKEGLIEINHKLVTIKDKSMLSNIKNNL